MNSKTSQDGSCAAGTQEGSSGASSSNSNNKVCWIKGGFYSVFGSPDTETEVKAINNDGEIFGFSPKFESSSWFAHHEALAEHAFWFSGGAVMDFYSALPEVFQQQVAFMPYYQAVESPSYRGAPTLMNSLGDLLFTAAVADVQGDAPVWRRALLFWTRARNGNAAQLNEVELPEGFDLRQINSRLFFAGLLKKPVLNPDGTPKPDPSNPAQPLKTNRAALLVPFQLKDIKKINDQKDDVIIQPLPPQDQNESDNDYIQRQIPDKCIAYIDPHGAIDNIAPEMPHLTAKLHGNMQGFKVKWRLEVDYQRLNGWRASYTKECLHKDEDLVRIPASQLGQQAEFSNEMDASEEWRIFESQDWQNEVGMRGFFGGTAKLYLWIQSQNQAPPTDPIITFRIGGKNPNPTIAKNFIQNDLCDSRLWFAYAIAKKESLGYDQPFYNQFFGSYRKQNGNTYDQNKDWQCWAKRWPVYNIDRGSRNGPMTSAGGYGIFQVTGDERSAWTVIPRRQIWNWQDNVGYQNNNKWYGAMGILKAKIKFVDDRYTALHQTYPSCGSIPNYPQNTASKRKRLSGWDAYTCKGYNGYGGTAPRIRINGFGKEAQWSVWHPQGNKWQFKDDGYTFEVWSQIEENN